MSRILSKSKTTFFFSFVLFIFLINLNIFIEEYCKFYNFKEPKCNKVLERIVFNKYIYFFTNITGIETGYGFFSPNVASGYVYGAETYSNKINKGSYTMIQFKNKESVIRFATAMGVFQNYDDKNILKKFRAQILLKGIGQQYLKQRNIDSVCINTYLYSFPSLEQVSRYSKTKIDYVFIAQKKINK
jgi:hypothetical protein